MDDLKIFWKESALYVGIYAVFALLICLLGTTIEWWRQTTSLPWSAVGLKYLCLLMANIGLFSISMFITGWHGRILGHELLTCCAMIMVSGIASYAIQAQLNGHLGIGLHNPMVYAGIVAGILLAPFTLFHLYVFIMGSSYKI